MNDTTNLHANRVDTRRIPLAWAAAVVAAIVVDAAIYLVADALGAIPEELPSGARQFSLASLFVVVPITLTVAAIALALFERYSGHPVKNFTILTVIVLATSLQPVLGIDGASAGFIATLLLMHLATAAIAWLALTRLTRLA